ncbi:MAG TPA: SDR family oxidoreductase [Herpetosiphonaceae bacterium]|nr:SDR family oxidoreductase [Herpetosiphonaceae bacterium]
MDELFSLEDKVAVVIGGTGVLGGAMARGLARAGARVGVLGRRRNRAEEVAEEIGGTGGKAFALPADVLRREQLEAARGVVLERWGRVDILVNAAGGNVPAATVDDNATIFDLPLEAFREVFDLNLLGTLLASQVLGEVMARRSDGGEASGCIVNVSSMAAQRPLTKVGGYSAAKAAVENLTRWLAVELSRRYGAGLRVNAIAPGFFLGEQNRALLVEEDGSLTPRGRTIVGHTPAGRFGEPEELVSTLIWLCGPGARFVNGIVVPVDGGFSAYSGV